MVLEEMVRAKWIEVRERKQKKPLESFRSKLSPSNRSLIGVLRKAPTGFILECKRASPSRGLLRVDFDPVEIAALYEKSADAVSVLCDRAYFGGDLAHLEQVSRSVTCPVMCKDFVVDPYQVFEARYYGADAILLMLSVLDGKTLSACLEACRLLGMDALVEIHDERELNSALEHEVTLLGINNRNLKTMQVDLHTTEKLAPLVPHSMVLISESGICNHNDVERLRDLVDGFLVGSALMQRTDLDKAVRELVYGRVKVCGLTKSEDVQRAYQAGACWGGLIFAEQSLRKIGSKKAEKLRNAADLHFAGVFVNPDLNAVVRMAKQLELHAVQIHGESPDDWMCRLRDKLPDSCQLWKAVQVADWVPLNTAEHVDRLVLDTQVRGLYGGSGKSFDWDLLKNYPQTSEIVLAGGIGVENAARAKKIGAWALDVNSGIEAEPGVKNERRMRELFSALRGQGRNAQRKDILVQDGSIER